MTVAEQTTARLAAQKKSVNGSNESGPHDNARHRWLVPGSAAMH